MDSSAPPNKIRKLETETRNTTGTVGEESEEMEILEKDLPLLANVGQVTVSHYLMKLDFLMEDRTVKGAAVLFIRPTASITDVKEIILDCCSLEISNVWLLSQNPGDCQVPGISEDSMESRHQWFKKMPLNNLHHTLTKWSITVSGWPEFPAVIRIDYKTKSFSPSLYWRPSQGSFNYTNCSLKEQCVYTAASPVNNRGLFPCQEHPTAMATWDAFVTIPKILTVLTTSDKFGSEVKPSDTNQMETNSLTSTFYFFTNHKLPMSTFAIFIGHFPLQHLDFTTRAASGTDLSIPHVRLFSVVETTIPEDLSKFTRNLLISAEEILGSHPFSRLDLVLMPICFHALGFANPHMIFLSPCLLTGKKDLLIYARIAHEIAHSWFGLSIGALDWAEEWLSEGFATFMEDIFYKEAMIKEGFEPNALDSDLELKAGLKLMSLQQELCGEEKSALNVLIPEEPSTSSCKNGLDPMKQFAYIHYTKGYFFLRYLNTIVGSANFLKFLNKYVRKYAGELVSSDEFLTFFYEIFGAEPNLESVEVLKRHWLSSVALPEPLSSFDIFEGNFLQNTSFFKNTCAFQNVRKAFHVLCLGETSLNFNLSSLTANELILFLEYYIRDFDSVSSMADTTAKLQKILTFHVGDHNPEVVHRWCEIIILKHKLDKNIREDLLKIIYDFLIESPAMGVYLYGELMISENETFQKMAVDLFNLQVETFDFQTRQVVKEMVAG